MNGLGGIKALRDRWRIEVEDARSGSRGTSTRLEVRARVQGNVRLGVGVKELMISSYCLDSTTL